MAASVRKALPFSSLLKKECAFEWTSKCEVEFIEFKRYLSCLLILSKPEIGKPLFLYLSESNVAIASALVQEDA